MAIEDWPAGLYPQQMQFRLQDVGVQFRSPFSGTIQSVNFVGEHWTCDLTLPGRRSDKGPFDPGPKLAAFLHWLKGGINQVRLYDPKYWQPRGTMTSATLQTTVTRGAGPVTPIILSTSVGVTLLSGDKFSVGGQWFEVRHDAVAGGSPLAMDVYTTNRVRATINAGAAVTLIKPTLNMIMPEQSAGVLYTPSFYQPVSLRLEEAP